MAERTLDPMRKPIAIAVLLMPACSLPDYVEAGIGKGSSAGLAEGPGTYDLNLENHWASFTLGWDLNARTVRVEGAESIDAIDELGERIEDLGDEIDGRSPGTTPQPAQSQDLLFIGSTASAIMLAILEALRRYGYLGRSCKNLFGKEQEADPPTPPAP